MPSDRPRDTAPATRRLALGGPGEPVEIAFTDWPGPDDVPPLLCIPGFTRTGRDFEELAKALAGSGALSMTAIVWLAAADWVCSAKQAQSA